MSDSIKHECGLALLRLKKPLSYYVEKYGTAFYGLNKLYLLMEKQHNRGQDGAGVVNIKLNTPPGTKYISRYRSNGPKPIQEVFQHINKRFQKIKETEKLKDAEWLKENYAFTGELYLGHLRYATYGQNTIEHCHPFLRLNNWKTRNLAVAGNFNLTNVDELFNLLVDLGQHPKEKVDTVTVLEKIGHFLDVQNEKLFQKYKKLGCSNVEISDLIGKNLDLEKVLQKASEQWDGGYAMAGLVGHGDAFVLRDPSGIRPCFYYEDEEVLVVTSERPVIQTAFNVPLEEVKELPRGNALILKHSGESAILEVNKPLEKKSCSFERIYFSRGSDADIYRERKELGRLICPAILNSIDKDLENSVFSFIPNTAETAFLGMIKGLEEHLTEIKKEKILALEPNDKKGLEKILNQRTRVEKIAIKDAKLRTFITDDNDRDDMVNHVYDITYNTVKEGDNLVIIDDSIVRGTTLRNSIIRILDRLNPKKIVVVSSAPQIRFPDCYGINMSKMGEFIAFNAAIELLKETGRERTIKDVYEQCKAQENLPKEQIRNYVKDIYAPFTDEEISKKIVELLTPKTINAEVEILYQSVDNLHKACPNHLGDWYFTGEYPTPGGNKVVNKAFINYYEKVDARAY